jgi:hypothetical protein
VRLTNSPPSRAECHGNLVSLNLLEPSGPHRVCYGNDLRSTYISCVCSVIDFDVFPISVSNMVKVIIGPEFSGITPIIRRVLF